MQTIELMLIGLSRSLQFGRIAVGRVSRFLLATLFLASISFGAQAQTDAYSILVAVTDRSAEEQQNAYVIGMRSVLLSNSGDKTLLNRDDVRAGLRVADQYVESFRYETPEAGTVIPRGTPLTDAVRETGRATQLMFIQFNREQINALIRSRGTSTAESEEDEAVVDPLANVRSALAWLIIDDAGREMRIGGSSGSNVMQRAREIAGGSGISLSFPAADSTDEQAVSSDDIKTGNVDRIRQAALRYAQPVVLAAHLTRTRTGTWEGTWLKTAGERVENNTFSSRSLDDALQLGLGWLGPQSGTGGSRNDFSSGIAGNVSSAEGLLWVSPIRSTQSYAEIMRFILSVDGVVSAYPKEVLSSGMVFAVTPRNALSAVSNAASNSPFLSRSSVPTNASASQFAQSISVSFEYLR